jgi:hypothetical protein
VGAVAHCSVRSAWAVQSPRRLLFSLSCPPRVRMGSAPGWRKSVGGVPIEAFGEVAVDVEDGLDRDVSEAGCDDGGVGALVDE